MPDQRLPQLPPERWKHKAPELFRVYRKVADYKLLPFNDTERIRVQEALARKLKCSVKDLSSVKRDLPCYLTRVVTKDFCYFDRATITYPATADIVYSLTKWTQRGCYGKYCSPTEVQNELLRNGWRILSKEYQGSKTRVRVPPPPTSPDEKEGWYTPQSKQELKELTSGVAPEPPKDGFLGNFGSPIIRAMYLHKTPKKQRPPHLKNG